MKLAVIGSRKGFVPEFVYSGITNYLHTHPVQNMTIISGGAVGVDTYAKEYAQLHNIPFEEFPADWERFGRSAGMIRNQQLISQANCVLAFWDQESKGTHHSIELAKKMKKPVTIITLVRP